MECTMSDSSSLPILVLALVLGMTSAARCEPPDRAWTSCLQKPEASDRLVDDCTAVLASGHGSVEERAMALNNRAAVREFATGGPQELVFRDYDEAIRLQPGVAKLYYNRAFAWLRHEENAKAIDDLDIAIRIDPGFAVAYGLRAEVRLGQKLYHEAVRDCDQAIRLAPGYLHALYNPYETRALALEAKGDVAGAAAERRRYAALSSKAPPKKPPPSVAGLRAWEPFMSK
jgi:tetratricopeptide (TPR) repeat protein